MIIKEKFSEIRKINNKLLYGSAAVLVVFFSVYFLLENLKLYSYRKESKPYTDNFLNLLINKEYDKIYKTYFINNSGNFKDFKQKMDNLSNDFGNVVSYEYRRVTASKDGIFGNLLGVTISYNINFNDGKNYLGYFSIEIDKKTNRPKAGKILDFNISGDNGKKYFTIRFQ